MPLSREYDPTDLNLENLLKGTRLKIPMLGPKNTKGFTVLRIADKPELQPVVDCTQTIEGKAMGPLMRFLGSVATGLKSEYHPDDLVVGKIVADRHLVFSKIDDLEVIFLAAGTVEPGRSILVTPPPMSK